MADINEDKLMKLSNDVENAMKKNNKGLQNPESWNNKGVFYLITQKWYGDDGTLWLTVQATRGKNGRAYRLRNPYGIVNPPTQVAAKKTGQGKPTRKDFEDGNIKFVVDEEAAIRELIEALTSHVIRDQQTGFGKGAY